MKPLPSFAAPGLAIVLFVGLGAPLLAAETNGKIVAVRPDQNQFVLTENFKNLTFQVNNASKIFINDREAKLADLQLGDEASVTFDRQGRQLTASVVRCTRKIAAAPRASP